MAAPAAREGSIMREYEVKIGGIPHTMQLDDADVKRYGAVEHKAPKSTGRKATSKKSAAPGDDSDD